MACRRQGSDLLLAGGRHWSMVQLHVSWDFVNHYECLWVVGFCFTLEDIIWSGDWNVTLPDVGTGLLVHQPFNYNYD